MDGETIKLINEAERRANEYTEKSHGALAEVQSKHYGALTDKFEALTLLLTDSRMDRQSLHSKMDTIVNNTSNVNNAIKEIKKDMQSYEKKHDKDISTLTTSLSNLKKDMKIWTLKALIITTVAGGFLWIKESRDAIGAIIKVIL